MNTPVFLVVPSGSSPEVCDRVVTAIFIHYKSKNSFYKQKRIFSSTEPFTLKKTTSMSYILLFFFVTGNLVHSKCISSPSSDILAFPEE